MMRVESERNMPGCLNEADIVPFDHGFKYLGVTFLKSMIFVPYDKPKKEMNLDAYYLKKKLGW